MTEHKLIPGKLLIKGIDKLGAALGYHVEKEFPVADPTVGKSQAVDTVDVAWFSKKGDRFPLFIFEVESSVTSGMASNPLKVYAQESRSFEKPLFFFHAVVEGGSRSSKPCNLEAQYGKNNYRISLVGEDSANILIQDVLNQHARIRNEVNYFSLHQLLGSAFWKDKVDNVLLLKHATILELSKESIIASCIRLTRINGLLLADLLRPTFA